MWRDKTKLFEQSRIALQNPQIYKRLFQCLQHMDDTVADGLNIQKISLGQYSVL